MIEPTDEMRQAFADAKAAVKGCPGLDDGDDEGLAAVLAIVARDRCLAPAGHVYHPLAAPRLHAADCSCVDCALGGAR